MAAESQVWLRRGRGIGVFLGEFQGRREWCGGVFAGIWSADPSDGVLSVRLFPVVMALSAVLWRELAAAGGRG